MKPFTSIFRRERRQGAAPDSPRKRPGRSFAAACGSLESRALLTTIGTVSLSADLSASAALAGPPPAIVLSPMDPPPPDSGSAAASSTQFAITGSLALPASSTQVGYGATSTQVGYGAASTQFAITGSLTLTKPVATGAGGVPPNFLQAAAVPGNPSAPPPSDQQVTSGLDSDQGGDSSSHDRIKNHVALDVKEITIGGVATPEFALADAYQSKVFVKLGTNGAVETLGPSEGINHPLSVTLQDVNNDGIPDLIVANTGGNNVLVFPGLIGGLFGPEVNGGRGFTVGSQPVSVTVDDLSHNGVADLIVANQASNTVSILYGQGEGASWTTSTVETIQTLSTPVKAVPFDFGRDGTTDLFVCNSGSNSVSMYQGQANGMFDPKATATFTVGLNPSEMFIGRFDKRPQIDLVTVNSGSDDVTFIGGIFGPRPVTQTVSSGGVLPDAAFAIDTNHNGVMDLMVANSGDGHMAFLQASNNGLQLVGVITQASLPVPTALAGSSWGDSGVDFYAASAGQDAAELLHFDLGIASSFLPGLQGGSTAIGQGDEELFSELMPFGDSSLELIAVFWAGSPESEVVGGLGFRESSMITALYSPIEGQGTDEVNPAAEVEGDQTPQPAVVADPSKVDSSDWTRFVLGLDAALEHPLGLVEAVAGRDALALEGVPPIDELARIDRLKPSDRAFDPDVEAASGVVDEALRLFWSEGATRDGDPPAESTPGPEPTTELRGIDAPGLEGQLESLPLISSALLISTRLILKGSPPRPSMFRRKSGVRGFLDLGDARASRNRPGSV